MAELKAGFGFDGPFLKARDSVRELEERIDTFIDDTLYTFGTGNDALSQAKEASRDFALTTLSGADGLSDVAKAIQDLEGRADRMSPLLMKLGMSATEAADAIENALSTGLNRLRDNFNESVQSSINTLDGKSYLNDFRELFVSVDQMFSDASRLGADADLVQEYFAKQAQAFVDNAELSGDAFNDLLVVFPRLIGLVEQFSSTVDRATELQAYSAELQAYSAAELDRAVSDLDSARQNLNAAYQREKSEIESLIQRHEAFKESLQSFLKNMLLSEDSPLSGEDKFLKAQADFRELQQKALAGDQEAQDKLLEASQSYLDEARSITHPVKPITQHSPRSKTS